MQPSGWSVKAQPESVPIIPPWAVHSTSHSLSTWIHMWVQVVWYNLLFWMFLLCFSMLILTLPLSVLGSMSTFFALGSVYVGYGSTIWTWNSFPYSLFFPGFWQSEILILMYVEQEPGDAGSKASTRFQVKVDYFIIPYTSIVMIASFVPGMSCIVYCYYKGYGDGIGAGDGWLKLGCR